MKKILFSLAATMLLVMGGLKAQDFVQVGVGDTTTYHLPSYFFYEYSCAQMTYYADDLIYAGLSDGEYIYGIAFNYTAGNAKQRYIRVYIYSPTSSTFSNTNEWWDEDDMHLVYSGEYCVSAEAGWKTIWFETPYQYDGGNIGIAVYDYTAGDLFGQRYVQATKVSNSCLGIHRNALPFRPNTMEGNDGTIRNSRPDIRFMTAERGYDNIISSLPSVDVPWTENFNGTPRGIDSLWYTQNAFHYIWRFDANNTYTNNDPDNFAIGVTTNDGSAYAHIFAENDENLEGILISPIINMNGQSGTLTFKYCNKSWFYDFDTIIVMGLDPSSQDIMPLLTIDEPSDTWQEVSVELPTCQQIIIGFAAHNGYGYGIGIDDISVAARPNAYLLGFDYGIVGDTMSFITLFNEDVDNTWDISGTDNEWYEQVDNMFEMAYAVWDTPGNYTISLTATRGNLSTTVTKNITIMNHRLACFDFSTEEQFQEWTVIDNDGDQSNWEYDNEWQAVRSRSWDQHPMAPDNWLISPAIHLPNNTAAIAWLDYASDKTDYAEHYSVLVSTSGTDISDFTDVVFETTIDKGQTWQTRVVNLSNYSNQDIYIAFRHHDCTDQKELYLNSICVMVNSLDEVGIADVESSDINIFPNPANDRVKVSANETIRNIKLYSMTGAMISNFETETTEYEISTCNIPAGAYIIRITTDNGVSNRRLIIK